MRHRLMIVCAIIACLGASGCRMTVDITRNLVFETCLCADEVKGKIHYRMLANSAWETYQGEHPDCATSKDFAKGFKRGYADYLEFGGECCLPRPQPPLRYLKVKYQSPEGRAATVAWLDGFRAGATAAKASGYRELIIVPVGKTNHPPAGAPPMPPIVTSPADGPLVPGTPAPPPVEELPVPRAVPEAPSLPPPNDKG